MTITVYSKPACVYCDKAKALLKGLKLSYTEKKMESFDSVDAMLEDIGKKVRSMPQIKINDELIGGYDEIKGKKIRIDGYLEEFSLSRKEADDLIMAAREIAYK